MDFANVAHEMFGLYREGRYQEGAALVAQARPHMPERDGRLTFWEACLLSRAGDPEAAIETLWAGTQRGLWWPEGMLADSDLDLARRLDRWSAVVVATEAHERARMATRPAIRTRPSLDGGTVVALHGGHAEPDEFADRWEAGVPDEWGVATPVGTGPLPEGGWSWGHDPASQTEDVIRQLSAMEMVPPVIVIGFSAGAILGIGLVSSGLEAACLVLMSPYLPHEQDIASDLGSFNGPVVLVYGSEDPESERYDTLSGIVAETVVIPKLGHALPQDLKGVFDMGLRAVGRVG